MDHDATDILLPSAQNEQPHTIFGLLILLQQQNDLQTSLKCQILYPTICIAHFTVLSPEQLNFVNPVHLRELDFLMHQFHEESNRCIHRILRVPSDTSDPEQCWFPTPKQPGDPEKYTPIQIRIYNELLELQNLEALNPQQDREFEKILSQFRLGKRNTDT